MMLQGTVRLSSSALGREYTSSKSAMIDLSSSFGTAPDCETLGAGAVDDWALACHLLAACETWLQVCGAKQTSRLASHLHLRHSPLSCDSSQEFASFV